MAAVDEGDPVRQDESFNLVVASKTYHEIFVLVSLTIFDSSLEDLLIL